MFHRKPATALTERQQRIYDFLSINSAGVLATVDPNGEPHAVVIYHAINKEFCIYFLTQKGTKKYDNLIRNNHVFYVVFETNSQSVVQISGLATEIKDNTLINEVAASVFATSLATSEGGVPPVAKLQAGDYTAFKVEPKQIRMASYIRPDSGDYSKIFESIESFELNAS